MRHPASLHLHIPVTMDRIPPPLCSLANGIKQRRDSLGILDMIARTIPLSESHRPQPTLESIVINRLEKRLIALCRLTRPAGNPPADPPANSLHHLSSRHRESMTDRIALSPLCKRPHPDTAKSHQLPRPRLCLMCPIIKAAAETGASARFFGGGGATPAAHWTTSTAAESAAGRGAPAWVPAPGARPPAAGTWRSGKSWSAGGGQTAIQRRPPGNFAI